MPYDNYTKEVDGKKKWCMKAKETGKEYCFDSEGEREKGKEMHEAFSHGWKPSKKYSSE